MRVHPVLVAVFFSGMSIAAFAGQPPPAPPGVPGAQAPRDRSAAAKPATAIIRGRVFAADTGQPIRKAFVRASSPDLREGRMTSTDVEGRYELKELPAGRYTLNASKGSFVSLSYGQVRPFEPGKPLEIADSQVLEKVDFSLPRGSVITGRILDEFGEPVADAQVAPMRYVNQGGRRRLQPTGRMAMTNDVGEYRMFGLPPGQYYISATLRAGMGLNVQSDDRSGYAPTYFPGTPNPAEAQKLAVGLAQTLNEVNITLTPTRLASISGIALDAQGRPLAGGMVMIVQRQGTAMMMNTAGQIRPDGTFSANGLAPGEYTLQTNAAPGGGFDQQEVATADVTVTGEDITGLRLTAVRAVSITGRILFTDPRAASAMTPGMVRLSAQPKNPLDFLPMAGGQGRVGDDFTFEIKARPANVVVRATVMPGAGGSWALRSVKWNGVDVTDGGIDLKPGEDVSGLEVEITNRLTEISGLVANTRGETVKDYSLVIFARDRERWGPGSRFVRTGRPDQDGRFKISGLPPGSYYAIALDYFDPADDASDPEFLDRIRDRATAVSVIDGETKTIDLKLTAAS